jgi:ParB/RepB/Spo0J family partition protein
MTSGQFHSIPVDQIKVHRDQRQRKELVGIDVLADSIHRLGLIHPITIQRDGTLVAGERRLEAVRSLGHDSITCQYIDELDDLQIKAIELEENIKRQDLTWQDQSRAVADYHELRTIGTPGWTHEQTAEALGLARPTVTNYLRVQHEVRGGNTGLLSLSKASTAIGKVARTDERMSALKDLHATIGKEEKKPSVINGDFLQWAKTYDGPKFNFIHCDFPYGIEANKMQQGNSVALHGGYDDSKEVYWRLLESLCLNLNRIADPSCHIMFWFSMHYYTATIEYLANFSDFVIDPFPLVWLKSDNIGLLPDPQRGPRRIYETALFGSRGDRKITGAVSNAFAAPTDRSQHMSTKPVPVLQHFFRMFVDGSTALLDPTCGSGSALRAAESCHAAFVLGIERDPEFAERANLSLEVSRGVI